MKPTLQFKLSQQLALTPQLQQSIRLLQLSTLELNQELEQALADNPLLERTDDPLDMALRLAPNGGLDLPQQSTETGLDERNNAPANGEATGSGDDSSDGGNSDGTDTWDGDSLGGDSFADGGNRSRGDEDGEERSFLQLAGNDVSLRDHLVTQLGTLACSRRDRALITVLIEELNRDGYLETSLDEILSILPAELEIDPSELSTALKLLQSMDPVGVGARTIAECLQLQIASVPSGENYTTTVKELAIAISRDFLPLLAAHDFVKLKRALRCDDKTLRLAQQLIQSLNPRPGASFSSEPPNYVVPDVLVRKTRSGWQASLNPDVLPKLRINDIYAQVLKRNRGANGGMAGQLQEARWLIKNVQQRFDTILRVAQAIVERQRSFFSHGAVAMRPLVLREIADAVGLHESTISRVTTQKYMHTPYGTLELKYFFGSHVATESGGAASSTAIRELIKQLISTEDDKSPLSDSHIADLLGDQGIMVARRTVAKYRDALRIPAVAQRKAL